jgi:hypothetical protein
MKECTSDMADADVAERVRLSAGSRKPRFTRVVLK